MRPPRNIRSLNPSAQAQLGEVLLKQQAAAKPRIRLFEIAEPVLRDRQSTLVKAIEVNQADQRVAELNSEAREADREHDTLVGLLDAALQLEIGLAEWKGDHGDARLLRGCAATLLPEGRGQGQKPWHEEAKAASTYAAQLTKAQLERLERLKIGEITAMDLVRAWVAAAERLGRCLAERAEAQAVAGLQVDLRAAKEAWAESFTDFLSSLSLGGVPEAEQALMIQPFVDALRMHRNRVEARKGRAAADEALAPAAAGAPVSEGPEGADAA